MSSAGPAVANGANADAFIETPFELGAMEELVARWLGPGQVWFGGQSAGQPRRAEDSHVLLACFGDRPILSVVAGARSVSTPQRRPAAHRHGKWPDVPGRATTRMPARSAE